MLKIVIDSNLFIVLFAYIIGAIPTGFIVARLYGIADIRRHGSGNIGATNVARQLGAPFFFIVLFCDALKAYAMMRYSIVSGFNTEFVAFALLLGNCFSPFLKGSGGKGVATVWGIIGSFSCVLAGLFAFLWAVVFFVSRIPFIASLLAVCVVAVIGFYTNVLGVFLPVAAFLLIVRHYSNILSLFQADTV